MLLKHLRKNPRLASGAAGALLAGAPLLAYATRRKKQRGGAKKQTGSGLLENIVSPQRLDIAGWQARFAAENALKHLRENPRLASGAAGALLAGAPLLAYATRRKKQRGGAKGKTTGGITKKRRYKRRQKGAGILRKIPLLGNLINMLI